MHHKRGSLDGPGKGVNEALLALAAGGESGWADLASWACAAAGADHVLVLLRDTGNQGPEREPLAAVAKTDFEGVSDRPRLFTYARALAGWVSRTQTQVEVSDAAGDARFSDPPETLRAALAVPVTGSGETRGAVTALYAGDLPAGAARATAEAALATAAAAAALVADRNALETAVRDLGRRRRELETELASARRWSAVGRMALDIAGEFKNPLAGLGTAAHRLEDAVPASDPRRPLLEVALQEIEHLNRLVAEQIELGNSGDPRLAPEDLNRLLMECVELCAGDLKAAKVKVTQRMGASLPPLLLDTDLMRRVFLNLIRTAVAHAAPGGRIKMQTKRAGSRIEVQVTADGPRDPGQSLENLWRPFMGREGGSVSSESIQRILRDHQAALTVSTTADWPLVFSLSLPIAVNQDRRQSAPDRRAGGDRRKG